MWNRRSPRNRHHGGTALALALIVSAALPRIAAGQESQPPATSGDEQEKQEVATATRNFFSTLGHNLADDLKHIPRRNSLYWAVGGGAAALAVHPADKSLNRRLRGSEASDTFFKPGKYIGSTEVQVGAALATYVVGRINGSNRVRHLGMDLIEADLLSEGIVEAIKVSVRRPRPPNPDGTPNPAHSFSFPSGHAAITFAGATVLQQHLGWKAAVPTYTIASYVAISRMHDNRHYLSDVVFGATTGVIIGRSVTWHGRNNYPIVPAVGPNYLGATMIW